jgi:hypothetical protein
MWRCERTALFHRLIFIPEESDPNAATASIDFYKAA